MNRPYLFLFSNGRNGWEGRCPNRPSGSGTRESHNSGTVTPVGRYSGSLGRNTTALEMSSQRRGFRTSVCEDRAAARYAAGATQHELHTPRSLVEAITRETPPRTPWAPSRIVRNKKQHALNGNTTRRTLPIPRWFSFRTPLRNAGLTIATVRCNRDWGDTPPGPCFNAEMYVDTDLVPTNGSGDNASYLCSMGWNAQEHAPEGTGTAAIGRRWGSGERWWKDGSGEARGAAKGDNWQHVKPNGPEPIEEYVDGAGVSRTTLYVYSYTEGFFRFYGLSNRVDKLHLRVPPEEMTVPEYVILMSKKKMNQRKHAENGNGKKGAPDAKAPYSKTHACIDCNMKFDATHPHMKRCSPCFKVYSKAGASDAKADAAADDMGMGDGGKPADDDKKQSAPEFGPHDKDVTKAKRAEARKEMKPVWATIMMLYNCLLEETGQDFVVRKPDGTQRSDGAMKTVILGSASGIEPPDHIITFDHNAYSEEFIDYGYQRDATFVEATVNGHRCRIDDWLYVNPPDRVVKLGANRYTATPKQTMQAMENGKIVNVTIFDISPTDLPATPLTPRITEFRAQDARGSTVLYRSFKGAIQTAIRCGPTPVQIVDTSLFNECGRYFVSPESSRVAESTIRGTLKNNARLTDDEMDSLLRYYSAKHQTRVVTRNAAIGGRPGLWRAAKAALESTYETQPWWMPTLLWTFLDPYTNPYTITSGMVSSVFLIIAGWYAFTNAWSIYYGALFGAEQIASWVGIGAEAVGRRASEKLFRVDAVHEVSTTRYFDFLWCGHAWDYLHWIGTHDQSLGWKLEDLNCPVWQISAWSMFFRMSFRRVHSCILAPIYEELLKRLRFNQGQWQRFARLFARRVVVQDVETYELPPWWEFVRYAQCGLPGGVFMGTMLFILVEWAASGFAWNYGAAATMHLYAARCSWWFGIIVHMAYNCISEFFFPQFPSGSGYVAPFLALAAFVAERRRTYRKIEPMGLDSEFNQMLDDEKAMENYPMKEDSELHVKPTLFQRGKSRLYCLLQPFCACASFAANQANIVHSLAGRVLKATPPVTRPLHSISSIISKMSWKMGSVEAGDPVEWASKFPKVKRDRYLKALMVLGIFGFAFFNGTLLGARHHWDKRSCFLKHEVNLVQPSKIIAGTSRSYRIACSDPRTIQACADEIQVALGPFFVAAGDRAAYVFDGSENSRIHGWRVCAGFGRTKSQVAQIMSEIMHSGDKGIVACGDDNYIICSKRVYAIDATRWDAHVGPELLGLKKNHLLRIGLHPTLVRMIDNLTVRRGGYQGSRVKFVVNGDVASGDADTLYWNTICGIAVIIDSFIDVDDYIAFEKRAKELGIEYELAAESGRTHFSAKLDFCSCVFVPVAGGGFTLAPKLGRSLMKLSHSANTNLDPSQLLASKIQGLTYDLCAFPEIVRALRSILRELPRVGPTSESYFPVGKCDPGTFYERQQFFSERYGLDYAKVVDEVETWVQRDAGEGNSGDLTTLRHMVSVDYGKTAMPPADFVAPLRAPQRRGSRFLRQGFVFMCMLSCMDFRGDGESRREGGLVKSFNFTPATTELSTANTTRANATAMPNKTNTQNATKRNNKRRNRRRNQGRRRNASVTVRRGNVSISGRGAYTVAGLASAVASRALRRIPKGTFEAQGARLGGALGRGLSNFTGVGDYVFNDIVHTPALPTRNANNTLSISHCEYVTDVTSEGGAFFNPKTLKINPYETAVFPWMSKLGQLYTKYRFVQLIFEYRSNCSDYAASGPLGTIIMAPQYNALASDFVTKQQMEAATHAVSSKPSNGIMCGFECAPSEEAYKWFFVREGGTDVTPQTDMGRFTYATYGLPQAAGVKQSLGELWVHYTVEFNEPILTKEELESDGVYGAIHTWNSTTGRLKDSLAGISIGAQTAAYTMGIDLPYKAISSSIGRPTGDYFVAVDTTNAFKWYVSKPGKYLVTVSCDWTATPVPNGAGDMYTVAFTNGTGTIAYTSQCQNFSNGRRHVCEWLITTNTQDAELTFAVEATYTNLNTVVPDGSTSGNYSGDVRWIAL